MLWLICFLVSLGLGINRYLYGRRQVTKRDVKYEATQNEYRWAPFTWTMGALGMILCIVFIVQSSTINPSARLEVFYAENAQLFEDAILIIQRATVDLDQRGSADLGVRLENFKHSTDANAEAIRRYVKAVADYNNLLGRFVAWRKLEYIFWPAICFPADSLGYIRPSWSMGAEG